MVSDAEQRTYEWLARVEDSVEEIHAAMVARQRGSLLSFIDEMESACRERSGLAATPAMTPRLGALRERLRLLQSMLRQASKFIEGREQLETERILGYTPRGLERAL